MAKEISVVSKTEGIITIGPKLYTPMINMVSDTYSFSVEMIPYIINKQGARIDINLEQSIFFDKITDASYKFNITLKNLKNIIHAGIQLNSQIPCHLGNETMIVCDNNDGTPALNFDFSDLKGIIPFTLNSTGIKFNLSGITEIHLDPYITVPAQNIEFYRATVIDYNKFAVTWFDTSNDDIFTRFYYTGGSNYSTTCVSATNLMTHIANYYNKLDITVINSSRLFILYHDYVAKDLSYEIINQDCTAVKAITDIDTNMGFNPSISITTYSANLVYAIYFDNNANNTRAIKINSSAATMHGTEIILQQDSNTATYTPQDVDIQEDKYNNNLLYTCSAIGGTSNAVYVTKRDTQLLNKSINISVATNVINGNCNLADLNTSHLLLFTDINTNIQNITLINKSNFVIDGRYHWAGNASMDMTEVAHVNQNFIMAIGANTTAKLAVSNLTSPPLSQNVNRFVYSIGSLKSYPTVLANNSFKSICYNKAILLTMNDTPNSVMGWSVHNNLSLWDGACGFDVTGLFNNTWLNFSYLVTNYSNGTYTSPILATNGSYNMINLSVESYSWPGYEVQGSVRTYNFSNFIDNSLLFWTSFDDANDISGFSYYTGNLASSLTMTDSSYWDISSDCLEEYCFKPINKAIDTKVTYLNNVVAANFTIMLWSKNYADCNTNQIGLALSSTLKLGLRWSGGNAIACHFNSTSNYNYGSYSNNDLRMIGCMFNGTHTISIYNGLRAISGNGLTFVNNSLGLNFTNIYINGDVFSNDFCNGTMDNIMIFNRTLTSSELLELNGSYPRWQSYQPYQSFPSGLSTKNYSISTDARFYQTKFYLFANTTQSTMIDSYQRILWNFTSTGGETPPSICQCTSPNSWSLDWIINTSCYCSVQNISYAKNLYIAGDLWINGTLNISNILANSTCRISLNSTGKININRSYT